MVVNFTELFLASQEKAFPSSLELIEYWKKRSNGVMRKYLWKSG
jgi:hypothetical protein